LDKAGAYHLHNQGEGHQMRSLWSVITVIATTVLMLNATAARAERVYFDSAARTTTIAQLVRGDVISSDHIYADLQLPAKDSGPFPAMVIMHSSRGV
jgi:hypothetical protein